MAYMKTNPGTKRALAPILQSVMKRAQLLKGEIAVATNAAVAEVSGKFKVSLCLLM
eukprot:COSAG05_NODE_4455_length_1508_cov_1.440738_2_plen_56_part_00